MTQYSKFNVIYRLQKWLDSVPGQTFMNYAYSWGASIVILGTLFKLTHLPGANFMLFLGMGTEVSCSSLPPSTVRSTRQPTAWTCRRMLARCVIMVAWSGSSKVRTWKVWKDLLSGPGAGYQGGGVIGGGVAVVEPSLVGGGGGGGGGAVIIKAVVAVRLLP